MGTPLSYPDPLGRGGRAFEAVGIPLSFLQPLGRGGRDPLAVGTPLSYPDPLGRGGRAFEAVGIPLSFLQPLGRGGRDPLAVGTPLSYPEKKFPSQVFFWGGVKTYLSGRFPTSAAPDRGSPETLVCEPA